MFCVSTYDSLDVFGNTHSQLQPQQILNNNNNHHHSRLSSFSPASEFPTPIYMYVCSSISFECLSSSMVTSTAIVIFGLYLRHVEFKFAESILSINANVTSRTISNFNSKIQTYFLVWFSEIIMMWKQEHYMITNHVICWNDALPIVGNEIRVFFSVLVLLCCCWCCRRSCHFWHSLLRFV